MKIQRYLLAVTLLVLGAVTVSADIIKIKRGPEATLPATLPMGTPAMTTDTHRVYVGYSSGKVELQPKITAPTDIGALAATGNGSQLTGITPAQTGSATAAQGAKADSAYTSARPSATYTILPYGDTRLADYYCTATDCGPAFQAAFNAGKASGKGGLVQLLDGVYPVLTSTIANAADSMVVKGVAPMGMWGDGGTIVERRANVTVFDFSGGVSAACEVSNIHWQDAADGYTAPLLKYVDAINMAQQHNYFDDIPQAIYAEAPWDFWTMDNNFGDCGRGDTRSTACIAIYNGPDDKAAGWMIAFNRFEERPGTSIYSDATGASGKGNDTILITDNKFEGVDNTSYPAVHGEFWGARIIGNTVYKADSSKPPIWVVNQGAVPSGLNVIQGNRVSNHRDYAISVAGNANNIGGNTFDTSYTPAAHIRVDSGTGNKIGVNAATGAIAMLSDAGTGTQTFGAAAYLAASGNGAEAATVTGVKSTGKQLVFDANGNVIASAFDAGATSGGGPGSGTVASGSAGQVAYYQDNGTTVTGKNLAVGDVSGAQAALVNSVGLATALSDETGTGKAVFSDSPELSGTPYVKATLGANVVTNGTFDSTLAGWSATSNWAWSGGKALHTAGGSAVLYSTGTVTSGALYKVSFDVSGMTTGTVAPTGAGWASPPTITANGSYVFYLAATSTAAVGFAPSSTFDGGLDNVVIAAVTGGVSVGDNFAVTGAGQYVGIGTATPSAPLEIFGNGINSLAYITAYSGGDNANFTPSIVGRGARGIQSTPIQSKTGDTLMLLGARGHDGTNFSAFSKGDIGIYAGDNWTSTAQGTYIAFRTTATGGTTRAAKALIGNGLVVKSGAALADDPGAGNIAASADFVESPGADYTDANVTVSEAYAKLTVTSTTQRTVTLVAALPKGVVSKTVEICGAAGIVPNIAWAAGAGTVSFGDAGAPVFPSGKCQLVQLVSRNTAATTAAPWKGFLAGGPF